MKTTGLIAILALALLIGPGEIGAHGLKFNADVSGDVTVDDNATVTSESRMGGSIPTPVLELRSQMREMKEAYINASPEERESLREEHKAERADFRESIKVWVENLRQEKAEMREARVSGTTTLSVRVQENIENFANGLFARLGAALDKLNEVAEKLTEKIEEHEEGGNDMGASSELLADANLKLEAAELAQAEADLAMETMLGAEAPREMLDEVRTELQEAKQALLEAKHALLDVVKQIRLDISAEAQTEAELEN